MNNPNKLAADLATNVVRYNRRDFVRGIMLLAMSSGSSVAQGLAGLGGGAEGFAAVVPGTVLTFPADHGLIQSIVSCGGTSPPIFRISLARRMALNGRYFVRR